MVYVTYRRAFTVIDRLMLGWAPVALIGKGLWAGENQVVVIGRDGKLGAIRRGSALKLWEKLPAPAVSLSNLPGEGAAVAVMNGTLWGFSKKVYTQMKFKLVPSDAPLSLPSGYSSVENTTAQHPSGRSRAPSSSARALPASR